MIDDDWIYITVNYISVMIDNIISIFMLRRTIIIMYDANALSSLLQKLRIKNVQPLPPFKKKKTQQNKHFLYQSIGKRQSAYKQVSMYHLHLSEDVSNSVWSFTPVSHFTEYWTFDFFFPPQSNQSLQICSQMVFYQLFMHRKSLNADKI